MSKRTRIQFGTENEIYLSSPERERPGNCRANIRLASMSNERLLERSCCPIQCILELCCGQLEQYIKRLGLCQDCTLQKPDPQLRILPYLQIINSTQVFLFFSIIFPSCQKRKHYLLFDEASKDIIHYKVHLHEQ